MTRFKAIRFTVPLMMLGIAMMTGCESSSDDKDDFDVWILSEKLVEEREQIGENSKYYVTGDSGDLEYHIRAEGADETSGRRFKVVGKWNSLPQKLRPNREYKIPFSIQVAEFDPQQAAWSPGASIWLGDSRPVTDPEHFRIVGNLGYQQVYADWQEPDLLESKEATARINPQLPVGEQQIYYGVRIFFGGERANQYHTYIYKWQPGPVEVDPEEAVNQD